jgi:hypothetical protein
MLNLPGFPLGHRTTVRGTRVMYEDQRQRYRRADSPALSPCHGSPGCRCSGRIRRSRSACTARRTGYAATGESRRDRATTCGCRELRHGL